MCLRFGELHAISSGFRHEDTLQNVRLYTLSSGWGPIIWPDVADNSQSTPVQIVTLHIVR